MELQLEGMVRAGQGLGAFVTAIECPDGTRWVIDYGKWAPYHAFADRRVVVCGEPGRCLAPSLPRILSRVGGKGGEFRVLAMRLAEAAPDAELREVEAPQHLSGRFDHGTRDQGEETLSFVTEQGNTFLLANHPAGASVGCTVTILASPVKLSPSWGSGAACGLWLHDMEHVFGTIKSDGIQLYAPPKAGLDLVAWEALEVVVRVKYPLSVHYQLELRDGSAVRVDILDEEQLARQLQERGVGFRRCDGTGTAAL